MPGEARDECALALHSIPYRQCLSVVYVVDPENGELGELQFLIGNVLARLLCGMARQGAYLVSIPYRQCLNHFCLDQRSTTRTAYRFNCAHVRLSVSSCCGELSEALRAAF